MKKAIEIINEMNRENVIRDYAIGGAIAALFYIEPVLTYDLDIFFIPREEKFDILSPIYEYLTSKGYSSEKEYIVIEGMSVQFIPVYNDLVKEGVEKAVQSSYKDIPVKILRPEYLISISLQTFRAKDIDRIVRLLEETDIDTEFLEGILKRHELDGKYRDFKENYHA